LHLGIFEQPDKKLLFQQAANRLSRPGSKSADDTQLHATALNSVSEILRRFVLELSALKIAHLVEASNSSSHKLMQPNLKR